MNHPRPPATERAEVVAALERVAAGLVGITARAVAEAAPASDLTLVQWRGLVVGGSSEGMRIGEIAAQIGSSVPSTSRLVRRLERRGLVTTERDDADRRATIVRSTMAGAAVRVQVIGRRRELLTEALASLADPLPKELEPGLEAIATALDRRAGHLE